MRYQSFTEFWPHYLREHAKPGTRMYHYIGTGLGRRRNPGGARESPDRAGRWTVAARDGRNNL